MLLYQSVWKHKCRTLNGVRPQLTFFHNDVTTQDAKKDSGMRVSASDAWFDVNCTCNAIRHGMMPTVRDLLGRIIFYFKL